MTPGCTRRAALATLAALAVPGRPRAQPALTPAQMREDLTVLWRQWAPRDRSFSPAQRLEFDGAMQEAIAAAGTRGMQDFALDIMRAVAIPRNGHTAPRRMGRLLGPLPLRAWWFPEGLHLVSLRHDLSALLGARVEALGPLSAEEAFSRTRP